MTASTTSDAAALACEDVVEVMTMMKTSATLRSSTDRRVQEKKRLAKMNVYVDVGTESEEAAYRRLASEGIEGDGYGCGGTSTR